MNRLKTSLKWLVGGIFMNLKNGCVWNDTVIKLSNDGVKNEWIPFYWGNEIKIRIMTAFPLKKGLI